MQFKAVNRYSILESGHSYLMLVSWDSSYRAFDQLFAHSNTLRNILLFLNVRVGTGKWSPKLASIYIPILQGIYVINIRDSPRHFQQRILASKEQQNPPFSAKVNGFLIGQYNPPHQLYKTMLFSLISAGLGNSSTLRFIQTILGHICMFII